MKELTIEEKVKAYDEAFRIAQELYNNPNSSDVGKGYVCTVFPELKESEDELKWLTKFIEEEAYCLSMDIRGDEDRIKLKNLQRSLAWLEKQGEQKPVIEMKSAEESLWVSSEEYNDIVNECVYGEQKPADKVEPKFHEGEWVVISTSGGEKVVQIDSIEHFKSGEPMYITSEGRWFGNGTKAHLWTIQDAKDGDVLLFEGNYNSIVLFQGIGINGKGRINYHCKCDLWNYSFGIQGDVACLGTVDKDAEHYHPATKEQRDTLERAITNAGYAFDFEKKELKKISQRMVSAEAKEALYDKPAWSEEDECYMAECINAIATKDGWSFEEKRKTKHWLKSLKQRIGWKPSDEQMKALHDLNPTGNISYAGQGQVLIELYNDLKKLAG